MSLIEVRGKWGELFTGNGRRFTPETFKTI